MWSLLLFSCHEEIRNRREGYYSLWFLNFSSRFQLRDPPEAILRFIFPSSIWHETWIQGIFGVWLELFFKIFFGFFFAPGNTESLITPKHLGPKFPAEKNKLADHCRVTIHTSCRFAINCCILCLREQPDLVFGTFKEGGSFTTVSWIMCLSTSLWVLECDVICFLTV